MANGKACDRPRLRRELPCIFHEKGPKDAAEFEAQLSALLADCEARKVPADCTAFAFPGWTPPPKTEYHVSILARQALFLGPVRLHECTFHQGLDLYQATFKADATLYRCLVRDGFFQACRFESWADFSGTQFEGPTEFSRSEFLSACTFLASRFVTDREGQSLSAFSAAFHGPTSFEFMELRGYGTFQGSRFLDVAEFIDVRMDAAEHGTSLAGSPGEPQPVLDMAHVEVAHERGLRFTGRTPSLDGSGDRTLDLSRVQFRFADVGRMQFLNIRWGGTAREPRVFDELLLAKGRSDVFGFQGLAPEHVAAIYKGLRLSYEGSLRYPEAGGFHIREMEMRRLAAGRRGRTRLGQWLRRNASLLAFYGWTSRYGEDYRRAALVTTAWFLAMGVFTHFVQPALFPRPGPGIHQALLAAIELLPASLGGASVTAFATRLVGSVLIATLLIALRRNFRR